ncbi:MAG TPA: hypothetical protein PKE38_02825 [Ignavibacteriaceae bacterium]|nr:hypothetical protein [Ignavibacteriaceae bacterium]
MIDEFLAGAIIYNVGYFFLKIITLGNYPKEYLAEQKVKIQIVGVLVIFFIIVPIISKIFGVF